MSGTSQLIPGREAMLALGLQLAAGLRAGDVLLLHGDLGAGKTTLTQGIAAGLGVADPIQSPTFTIVSEHKVPANTAGIETLFHLDLYRLDGPEDLETLGWEQFIAPVSAVSVIEWPERAGEWLPDRFLLVRISHVPGGRDVTIQAR